MDSPSRESHDILALFKFTYTVFTIIGVISIAALIVSTLSRRSPPPTIYVLPVEMRIGIAPMPPNCGYTYSNSYFTCSLVYQGHDFEIYYDQNAGIIESVTLKIKDRTIGDLILEWGTPIGYTDHDGVIEVRWNQKGAFLGMCSFRPQTRIYAVVYDVTTDPVLTWVGFRQSIDKCFV